MKLKLIWILLLISNPERTQTEEISLLKEKYKYRITTGQGMQNMIVEISKYQTKRTVINSYRYGQGFKEVVQLEIGEEGNILFGSYNSISKEREKHIQLLFDDKKVYIKNLSQRGEEVVLKLSGEDELILDLQLLLKMREFLESAYSGQRYRMIDFEGNRVEVIVSKIGSEWIEVPAGRFFSHHLQVEVRLFWLPNPRIDYWISAQEPHFLVRHKGILRPSAPRCETELLAIEKDNYPVGGQ